MSVTFYTFYSHIIKVAANFDQVLFNHKAYIHKRTRQKQRILATPSLNLSVANSLG